MCFSASASFGSGIVLTTIGIATVKKTDKPTQLLFAAIPLIFAIQQFTEGFLWLALTHSNWQFIAPLATYIFLFFAQVTWPFFVPLATLVFEKGKRYKVLLRFILVIGMIVAAYLAFCLATYNVSARIDGYHISYVQNYPEKLKNYGGVFYVIATVLPSFLSGSKKMKLLGIAILTSYLITKLFYENYVVSVWCFFSALISALIYLIISDQK